jgi:hypothetical protein
MEMDALKRINTRMSGLKKWLRCNHPLLSHRRATKSCNFRLDNS